MPLRTTAKFANHTLIQIGKALPASITKDEILAPDHQGYNLVHYAVSYGRQDLLQSFGSLGVSLDAQNPKTRESPLHLACKENNQAMASYLLDNGASVSIDNKSGMKPVHVAAQVGNTEIMKIFWEKDFTYLEEKTTAGHTVLAHIVANYQPGAADTSLKFLIGKADDNVTIDGVTLKEFAKGVPHSEKLQAALENKQAHITTSHASRVGNGAAASPTPPISSSASTQSASSRPSSPPSSTVNFSVDKKNWKGWVVAKALEAAGIATPVQPGGKR